MWNVLIQGAVGRVAYYTGCHGSARQGCGLFCGLPRRGQLSVAGHGGACSSRAGEDGTGPGKWGGGGWHWCGVGGLSKAGAVWWGHTL